MSTAKHTPGPWFTKREGSSTVYVEARIGGGYLQEVAACGPTAAGRQQQDANARVIATAPLLLEAIKINLELLEKVNPFKGQEELLRIVLTMNRELIAKAEGGAQ